MVNSFTPPEDVGFVGLGNMGAPMARRLAAAGYTLFVADTNPAAVSRFAADTHCRQAADLVSLGAACRAVSAATPEMSQKCAAETSMTTCGAVSSGPKARVKRSTEAKKICPRTR